MVLAVIRHWKGKQGLIKLSVLEILSPKEARLHTYSKTNFLEAELFFHNILSRLVILMLKKN